MKDFLLYVLIVALGAVLIVLGVIFLKYPNAKPIGPSIPTNTPAAESVNTTFNPNYENTGIFECGPLDFSAYIPSKYLELGVTEDEFGKLYQWRTPLIPESNTWVMVWCGSTVRYNAIATRLDNKESPENFVLADIMKDAGQDLYSVMVDHTVKEGDRYKLDYVFKKSPNLNEPESADYIYLRSKSLLDASTDRFISIILILYAYTYDQDMVNYFNTMVDSTAIIK